VREKNLESVLKVFENEGVEATPLGMFTEGNDVKVDYQGYTVAELNLSFLFSPPKTIRIAEWKEPDYREPIFLEPSDLTRDLLEVLSSPNIASKESVIRTYDHEVKGNTVLKPLQGKNAGPNDAAILKPLKDSWRGIVLSCGLNPNYGKIDPYWMAASAIDEAIRNNVCVGGRRIALLDNFTWGSPEKPDRLGGLVRACRACYEFARAFRTPFISGKDSLYNESPLGPVTPTLLITAVGIIPDIRKAVSADAKRPGDLIYLVGKTYPELGGSEYYKLRALTGRSLPKVRHTQARKLIDSVTRAIDSGFVESCHDLSEGGLAVAAAEMALSGGYGIELNLRDVSRARNMLRNDYLLFSESNSRFLVEVSKRNQEDFETLMKGNPHSLIGMVRKEEFLCAHGLDNRRVVNADLVELRNAWKRTLVG
jgi:phosphoribosylformylglycinamidine synthase